jgi:hypothetical protein
MKLGKKPATELLCPIQFKWNPRHHTEKSASNYLNYSMSPQISINFIEFYSFGSTLILLAFKQKILLRHSSRST